MRLWPEPRLMYLEDLQVPSWTIPKPKHKDVHNNNLEREKVIDKESKKPPNCLSMQTEYKPSLNNNLIIAIT